MLPSRRPGGHPGPVRGKDGREDGFPAWIEAPNSMNLGLGECFSPILVFLRKQDCPVVVLCQLLWRELAAFLD